MRRWLRIGLVVVFGGVALYALFAFATGFRATRLVNRLLHDWATQQVVEQSDSLYRLHIGRLHFNWPLRRITLDSAVITTDSARNAARTYPGATLNGALRTCVISGVDIVQLVLARGLEATQIGCAVVSWHAEVPADSTAQALYAAERASGRPRPRPAPAARTQISLDSARRVAAVSAATTTPQGLSTFQSRLRLPSQVPRIHIGRITFPALGTRLLQHSPSGDRAEFDLARARLDIENIIVDPAGDSTRAQRALFADNVVFQADSAEFLPDTAQIVRVGHLRVSIADSAVTIRDFEQGPRISDAEFQARSQYRRDRIRVSVGALHIRGVDRTAWSQRGFVQARALELDSVRFEIRSDKRKPGRPGPRVPKRSPQGVMARFSRGIWVDSIRITNGLVAYEEFAPRRDRPGRLTITDLNVLGLWARHVPGRVSGDSLVLDVQGRLMGQGAMQVHFEVPLDAPAFTMRVRGSVGAFDAAALNQLIEHIQPARIKSGRIDEVRFQYTVTNGVARGTLTPRYRDIAADVTGEGMTGILGRGPLGGLLRGAAEAAQGLKVHANNPGKPNEAPRVGTINHRFNVESLPAFVWNSIKSGLMPVVMK